MILTRLHQHVQMIPGITRARREPAKPAAHLDIHHPMHMDFALIVSRYSSLIRGIAVKTRGLEAEDVVQESLLRVWKGLPTYNRDFNGFRSAPVSAQDHFTNWIKQVVRNCIIDLLRRRSSHPKEKPFSALRDDNQDSNWYDTIVCPRTRTPSAQAASRDMVQFVNDILDRFDDSLMALAIRLKLQGRSNEVAAEECGISLSNFKIRIKRGLEILRSRLVSAGACQE